MPLDILTSGDDIDQILAATSGSMYTGAWDDRDAMGLSAIAGETMLDAFSLPTTGQYVDLMTSGDLFTGADLVGFDPFTGADLVGLDSVIGAVAPRATPAQLANLLRAERAKNAKLAAVAKTAVVQRNAARMQAQTAVRPPVGERGKLVDREPKKLRKYTFGVLAPAPTAAGAVGTVTTRPQVPLKIHKIMLRDATFWNIIDVKVGKDSQNAGGDPIPGEIFDIAALENSLLTDTASNGMDIIFTFQNRTGLPRQFHLGIIGFAVE